jgi:hypothetical protein
MGGTPNNVKFPGGTQDKGLSSFDSSIGAEITWDKETHNVSGGIRRGVGVRYGIAPLAGHSNIETPAANQTNGLMRSESPNALVGTTGLGSRRRIYGILPITMAPYDGSYPKKNRQFYLYIVGLTVSQIGSPDFYDASLGASIVGGINKQESNFAAGLAQCSYLGELPLVRRHKTELLNLPIDATSTPASVAELLRIVEDRWWAPICHISISGKRVPYNWMFARTTSVPTATDAPSLNLWGSTLSVGLSPYVNGGSPSEIITREFPENQRRMLKILCLDDDGYKIDISYSKEIDQSNTAPVVEYGNGDNYFNLTGATKAGASTSYSDVKNALIIDPQSYTNTKHDAILCAGEIPFAVVYQDWLKASRGMLPRFIDLSDVPSKPRLISVLKSNFMDSEASTCLFIKPSSGFQFVALGSDTGFLRENIVYDFGVSYYNKLIDFESNVEFISTEGSWGSQDNYGMAVSYNAAAGFSMWNKLQASDLQFPWEYSNGSPKSGYPQGRGFHINDYELRFYYRPSGIGEWLPAGSFDASQFFFYPDWPSYAASPSGTVYGPVICKEEVGANIGGQPNGFNDYSSLPKQRYICVLNFQQRAFWFSQKSMHFSYQDNVYAYATRNTINCPDGEWRGGITFSRIDDNIMQSVILAFSDKGAYFGRFTGVKFKQNVRVSHESIGQFDVDGSDFIMDYLSDATAYSYRAAVCAEGIAYWWGPQGVYTWKGQGQSSKISLNLESDDESENIMNWVDTGRIDEVHCVYNKRDHEILWFYPPKIDDPGYPTHCLVYNVENGRFYKYKIPCQVDSAQNIKIENDDTPDNVDGERILIHCREDASSSVQRTFYFDSVNKSGDQVPGKELTVISFSSPDADTRRLNIASSHTSLSTISIGNVISLQNVSGYAPTLTTAKDFIGTVVGKGASYIDIELPKGAIFPASATLDAQTAFPIYHMGRISKGLHGIPWRISTNYWLPGGLAESWYWQYFYFLFKYREIPTPIRDNVNGIIEKIVSKFTFGHRTLGHEYGNPPPYSSQEIQFFNNSRGHFQRLHQLENDERSANGQALSFYMSGIYIGDPWTLEYLEAHCTNIGGYIQKEFEV